MRKAVRKRVCLRGVVKLGESGPGGTTATEKPMRKESYKEKGVARLGESGPGGAKATEGPMCKESSKEKGWVSEGWSD